MKREPELKLEGRIECQPEYRKAYIDYLKRERVDRKPRPLDNLGAAEQTRRAFDVFNNNNHEEIKNENKAQNKKASS